MSQNCAVVARVDSALAIPRHRHCRAIW